MSGMLDKHLGASVSGTECKEIKSERKQEATLCNPVFSTEAVGLFGTFVQIEKRCFLWAHAAAQVLDLAIQVWPGLQSLLETFGQLRDVTVQRGPGLVTYSVLIPEWNLSLSIRWTLVSSEEGWKTPACLHLLLQLLHVGVQHWGSPTGPFGNSSAGDEGMVVTGDINQHGFRLTKLHILHPFCK